MKLTVSDGGTSDHGSYVGHNLRDGDGGGGEIVLV